MTDMPWDRFPEEDEELPYHEPPVVVSVPEPPPPPVQPTPPPAPTIPAIDWDEVLDDVWPMIKGQLTDYVKGTLQAGFNVDHAHPTITAITAQGKELVVADARSRSWRTLLQGLAIDLFFAVVVLLGTLTQADVLDKASWTIFFVLLGKTLIQTSVSYFMRLKVTPTMRNEEGEKMAIMPVPRPMVDKDRAA